MDSRRETSSNESSQKRRARVRTVELAVAGSLGAVALGLNAPPVPELALATVVLASSLLALSARRAAAPEGRWGSRTHELILVAVVAVAAVSATILGFGAIFAALVVCFSTWFLVMPNDIYDRPPEPRECSDLTLHTMLTSMARVSELHDQQTHGHCQRVAFDCVQVGTYLGLPDDDLYTLKWAALLHDVGKSVIPSEILLKPGALTPEEFEVVKTHCRAGADVVLATSPSLSEIAQGIAAHHERWDGHGYPVGLAGEAIPLTSRIIAVVDVFEALTTNRPYRNALDVTTAFEIIRAGAGTHFDPDIVAVFERLYASGNALGRGDVSQRGVSGLNRIGGSFFQEAGSIASLTIP